MIYLLCFITSVFILSRTKRYTSRDARFCMLSVIAILIPAILAGCRAETIGTDVSVYVKPIYNAAINSKSIVEYFNTGWVNPNLVKGYSYVYDYEYGFSIFVYIIAKLTHSINFVLFCIHLFIISFVYAGLSKYRDKMNVWLGMLVFYLMYFNVSLNMMRQWMAMAILIYASQYMLERRKKYFAWVIFAALFHLSSAIFGIIFYFVILFIDRRAEQAENQNLDMYDADSRIEEKRFGTLVITKKNIRLVFLIIICIAIIIMLPNITNALRSMGLSKYLGYVSGSVTVMPNQIILRVPFLLLMWCSFRDFVKSDRYAYFFVAIMLIDLLLSQLAGLTENSWRISAYTGMFNMISVPMLCELNKWKNVRSVVKLALIIYLFIYWYYYFVVTGVHATIPYIPYWS